MLAGSPLPTHVGDRGRRLHYDRIAQNRVQEHTRLPEHQKGRDPSIRPPNLVSAS